LILTAGGVGAGEEAAEALKVDESAAPVDGEDLGPDGAVLGLDLAHTLPSAGELNAADRQLELAVLVLVRGDLELPVVADGEDLLDVVDALHRDLLVGEEGRGLAANIDEGTLDLELHHLANDNVAELRGDVTREFSAVQSAPWMGFNVRREYMLSGNPAAPRCAPPPPSQS
jgi:hypothetical protein